MIFLKKFFITLFVVLSVSLISCTTLVIAISQGYLDRKIKNMAESYFGRGRDMMVINGLRIRNNKLFVDQAVFSIDKDTKGKIENLVVSINFNKLSSHWSLVKKIDADNFSILASSDQVMLSSNLRVHSTLDLLKNNLITKIALDNLASTALADAEWKDLSKGQASCLYKTRVLSANAKQELDCRVQLGSKTFLSFDSIIHKNIEAHGTLANIPMNAYKIIQNIIPANEVMLYLQEHIRSGHIESGEFDINVSKNMLKRGIVPKSAVNGKLHITNLEYKYDDDFPPLTNVDTNVVVADSSVQFIINTAYSGKTLLTNGVVTFKWEGLKKSNFIFKAGAQGDVLDLIDFIPNDAYRDIKEHGVDLKQIKGKANSNIEIIIPLSPSIKNTYNISSDIKNVSLLAFDGVLSLQGAAMNGTFDGKKIIITGNGKINDFASTLTYEHNTEDAHKDDYDYLLKIQTNIIARNQKIWILKLLTGSNILNFEYKKQKDGQNIITATSNLNKLEFFLDKVSIYKSVNKNANFTLKSNVTNSALGNVNFTLTGEDNLKIVGNLTKRNTDYQVSLPTISYGQTNLRGDISFGQSSFKARLYGDRLDLSTANMMQYLEKTDDDQSTQLKIEIKNVKLKNNIWLSNFNLDIECDKIRCYAGSLTSKIGTKSLKMVLLAEAGFERWLINCDNAGALFKGVGMYNNMREGTMNLALHTRRQEVKKGEIIPILDGTFTIKRFIVTDVPFLTRIVSFVSFPGLMSSIVNNKNILFESMKGKFSYISNIITFSDSEATGPFFDFTMRGKIDTLNQRIYLQGNVVPSIFFIGKIIAKIPVIGAVLSKVAPYSIEMKY